MNALAASLQTYFTTFAHMSLASVMGPPRCHVYGTTWRC